VIIEKNFIIGNFCVVRPQTSEKNYTSGKLKGLI